jgi:hypothetical protein
MASPPRASGAVGRAAGRQPRVQKLAAREPPRQPQRQQGLGGAVRPPAWGGGLSQPGVQEGGKAFILFEYSMKEGPMGGGRKTTRGFKRAP